MPRAPVVLAAVAVLVVAGCSSPPATPPSTDGEVTLPADSRTVPENATLWIDGTVSRVEDRTVYVDDQRYGSVVVPVVFVDGAAALSCRTGANATLDCEPVEVSGIRPGREVCALVVVRERLEAIKASFGATCGGPRPPPG